MTKEATESKTKTESHKLFHLKPDAKPIAEGSINPETIVILDDGPGFVVSAEGLDHDLSPEEWVQLEKWMKEK